MESCGSEPRAGAGVSMRMSGKCVGEGRAGPAATVEPWWETAPAVGRLTSASSLPTSSRHLLRSVCLHPCCSVFTASSLQMPSALLYLVLQRDLCTSQRSRPELASLQRLCGYPSLPCCVRGSIHSLEVTARHFIINSKG